METTPPDQPTHACEWTAPDPALAAALVGSVMHAQGFARLANPPGNLKLKPWDAVEFDRWAPQIQSALSHGDMTLDEVREGVALGWFQTWSLGRAVTITEMILSPRMRAFHVLVSAGDLGEIRDMVPMLEKVAWSAGCNIVGATDRKGWLRVLKPFGYEPSALQTVEKALS